MGQDQPIRQWGHRLARYSFKREIHSIISPYSPVVSNNLQPQLHALPASIVVLHCYCKFQSVMCLTVRVLWPFQMHRNQ